MRYPVRPSPDTSIALPEELAEALGQPDEAEVIRCGETLLVRPASGRVRMGRAAGSVAALDAVRASLRPGLGFTPEEESELREAILAAEAREREQILADFPDADLPA